jgi:hypothetical protein
MLPKGYYTARAVSGEFGYSSNKGTEQVAVEFEILDEAHAGERIHWMGFFTDKTTDRTMESLRICGWRTDDVTDLQGIGDNQVQLVVDHEEYDGKVLAKVQWVNRIGGGFKMGSTMSEAQKKAFSARMRGAAVKSRSAAPPANGSDKPKDNSDDVPF